MKKFKFSLLLSLVLVFALQITTLAAGTTTINLNSCIIQGDQVVITATGTTAQSDTGLYYLFSLEPYETGIGSRTDFLASTAAAAAVNFTTPLNLNTASSKLYSRFVIAAYRSGQYVAISNEAYITNPEAVATAASGYPARSKKGVIANWQYTSDLTDLNCGYATYVLNINKFFNGTGVDYVYNGKTYSFNAATVASYDGVCTLFEQQGVNTVMVIQNQYDAATLDLIPAAGRTTSYNGKTLTSYSFNVQEQIPTEKLEALLSFLASRYNGTSGHGTIHTWIIGNEVNNNYPAHYMGTTTVENFAADYTKQFRVCYNAIKSQNVSAKVYTNIDQRWNYVDSSNPLQYPSKTFIDYFASNITSSGNIDWGLSIHPHALPMDNCQFWNVPSPYKAMNLINSTDNSKFATIYNLEVFVNHMKQASMLNPSGQVRSIIITELGFNATSSYGSSEQIQAAALIYAYKKAMSFPEIDAFIIHKQVDSESEAQSTESYGLRVGNYTRLAYQVFKDMDVNDHTELLPYIGVSSWAALGLN